MNPVVVDHATVAESLQLGEGHPDHDGDQLALERIPGLGRSTTGIRECGSAMNALRATEGGELGGNVVLW